MPPARIQAMPRRRHAAATTTTVSPSRAPMPTPPLRQGVDAVVAWINRLNLATMAETATTDDQRRRHKALQQLIAAVGRCRSVARDVELLLLARQQREGVGVEAVYLDDVPDDAMSQPLYNFNRIAALCHLVAECDGLDADDLDKVTTRLRHHVAGVTVRESGETAAFKRRHRIGSDVAGAVENYAVVQQQLEKEALTDADAVDARDDLVAFGRFIQQDFEAPWHIQVIADALMKVERREIKGLLLNVPPRHGKTNLASILFASWYVGRHPSHDVIVGCMTADFAENNIGGPVRNFIQSPEYKRVFPGICVAEDTAAKGAFRIYNEQLSVRQRRGMFKAFGRSGSPVGSGASLLICDDFISESDAYNPTERAHLFEQIYRFRSRLAPNAVWVVINTRYHEDDIVGVVKKRYAADRKWETITLPVYAENDEAWVINRPGTARRAAERRVFYRKQGEILWPLRQADVEAQRVVLTAENPQIWSGQFMCRPVAESGAMIDVTWFRHYDYARVEELVDKAVRVVVSVDTGGIKNRQISSSAARTAITVWAELEDGQAYLIDIVAEPWIYPDIIKFTKKACNRWKPSDLLIEEKAAGVELIVDLAEHRDWVRTPITGIMPHGPKEVRMGVASPQIRSGQVYVPAQSVCGDVPKLACPAPAWVEDFLNEMMHFPLSSRKDQADSTSQFLNWRRENPVFSNYSDIAETSPQRQSLMKALAGPWGSRTVGQTAVRMPVGRMRR